MKVIYKTGNKIITYIRKHKKQPPIKVETDEVKEDVYDNLSQASINYPLVFVNDKAYGIHTIVSIDNPTLMGLIGALTSSQTR